MADQPISEGGPVGFPHRVLDCLTAMKLRVGWLRRRVRLGTITPEEIETHLTQIEQEIDANATLAQDVQARESSSAERAVRPGAPCRESDPDRR
jgi:hypothetical protein